MTGLPRLFRGREQPYGIDILKMPLDLSHANTFPATEGDNVSGALKVLLDQDYRFDEILVAGHRRFLLALDHLILVRR
jgi:hypothetical protein